jgi:hypothetical protein
VKLKRGREMTNFINKQAAIRRNRLTQIAAMVIGVFAFTVTQTASASNPMSDTLHGYCFAGPACMDNGTNTPTATDPPEFGFAGSGMSTDTGDLLYVFLLPTAITDPTSIGLMGAVNSPANLVSTTPFTSGSLETYLGISATPNNPIGAFSAGGTSFEVYVDDLGTQMLTGTTGPQETTSIGLPTDSYIVAFINLGTSAMPNWSATASSGAIFETGSLLSTGPVPEPTTLVLLGTGIIGAAGLIRRRIVTRRS